MRIHANRGSELKNVLYIEDTLQNILKGTKAGNFHPRYNGSPVGLAVVRASLSAVKDEGLSPLDPGSLGRLDRHFFNSDTQPGAWSVPDLKQYYQLLGGMPDASVGRFSAFALAKLNEILSTGKTSSQSDSKIETGPGRVGLAGGVRTGDQLTSVSGLWEVHDHAIARVVEQTEAVPLEVGTTEEVLRAIFNQIKGLHRQSGPADELSRSYIGLMLEEVDEIVADNLPIAA